MPSSDIIALNHAPVHAAAGADGLFATDDRETTDEQAHADDAHAAGADAADENPNAEDATDKDGDADGTARTLSSKALFNLAKPPRRLSAGTQIFRRMAGKPKA